MVYASFVCISVAMMSPVESFTDIKGGRFRFHLQALLAEYNSFRMIFVLFELS